MLETWRWFGPKDPVALNHVIQAGAAGIVTALHETYDGAAWRAGDILARRQQIEAAGLVWAVVESIPVPAAIKLGLPEADRLIDNWLISLRHLAEAGVRTICYNFMPVVDWTRTDLRYPQPGGALALRFDAVDFAAYDLFVLRRPGAATDYTDDIAGRAEERLSQMSPATVAQLEQNIIAGLPGAENFQDRETIRRNIAAFEGVDDARMRQSLIAFLERVVPEAERLGARLCVHPDDPPFSLFGLPRVVSTAADYGAIFAAVPSPANGLTFCTGSLGARADNDLLAMIAEFGPRIHFAHLRNVTRQGDGSFYEADHLGGDVDMVAVMAALLSEEAARRRAGRPDSDIPMRPDHGHLLLDDIGKATNPGYSAIGRLRGLAELRGVRRALEAAAV